MSQGAAAELRREIADAGRCLVRLIRHDPLWHEGLDIAGGGFVRSFFAPVFALPFHLVFGALFETGGAATVTPALILGLAIGHLLSVFGFPVLVALLARPLGFSAGYAPFVIVTNWAVLFVSIALCALAPLTLLGPAGFDILGILWMALFALRVFVTWRAARETLSEDIAPALLMVVVLVVVELSGEQVGGLIAHLGG